MGRVGATRAHATDATFDGELLLSFVVWPDEPPDPAAVDEAVRVYLAGPPKPGTRFGTQLS